LRLLSTQKNLRGPVIRLQIGYILGIPPEEERMTKPIKLIDILKRYGAILYRWVSGRYCSVDRRAEEKLYESGKETTGDKLLKYGEQNDKLKRKIKKLEKNSTDSSKPPSSDKPKEKKQQPKTNNDNNKKRKPGAQPGHKGSMRELIPVEEADDVLHYYPEKCKNCGKALPQDKTANEVGKPFR